MSLVETQAGAPSLRISFKNILFATDFSGFSESALVHASNFARRHRAKLWIAHVVPPEARLEVPLDPLPSRFDKEWTLAEQEMASLLKSPLLEGIPHESLLERGELWSTLSELITKSESDLMVVGTRGRGITKRCWAPSRKRLCEWRPVRC